MCWQSEPARSFQESAFSLVCKVFNVEPHHRVSWKSPSPCRPPPPLACESNPKQTHVRVLHERFTVSCIAVVMTQALYTWFSTRRAARPDWGGWSEPASKPSVTRWDHPPRTHVYIIPRSCPSRPTLSPLPLWKFCTYTYDGWDYRFFRPGKRQFHCQLLRRTSLLSFRPPL